MVNQTVRNRSALARASALLYALIAYALFLLTLLCAIAWVGNLGAPLSVDSGPLSPPGTALLIDLALLALFAIQHSLMARQSFKRRWARVVPAPVERSTYVLCASLALLLLFWHWRPLPGVVWDVGDPLARAVVWVIFDLGWSMAVLASFLINHFDLFGVRQATALLRRHSSGPVSFKTTWLYSLVRHPIMLGFVLAFWATPRMTIGHLVFAGASTAYILIGIRLEERDLRRQFGAVYAAYQARVPRLVPRLGGGRTSPRPRPQETHV